MDVTTIVTPDETVPYCWCAALLSTLIIFQSGMVWNSTVDETGLLAGGLEKLSIVLILMVTVLGIIAQIEAIQENNSDPRSFRTLFCRYLVVDYKIVV